MDAQAIVNRFEQLVSQRKTLDGRMQRIVDVVDPTRYDFFDPLLSDSSVDWEQTEIYDNTATIGYQLLAARIHANLMSPVTRWFNIRFRDDDLNTQADAKEWLEDSVNRFWHQLSESNFNNVTGEMLKDICLVGTSIVMQEPKDDLVWEGIDYTALPIMDSYFEMGPDDLPYRTYRKLRYTREQLQQRFPDMPDNIQIDGDEESSVDAKIEVIFCVFARDEKADNDEEVLAPDQRPFGYKYVLRASADTLEEGGYYKFPGMVVRWDKTAGTNWGTSPTSRMLENIKLLQSTVAHEMEAMAKAIDPPYITTERGVIGDLDSNPGGITVVTDMDELRPLLAATDFRIADSKVDDLQRMIWSGYYLDQLELKESPAMTATEVQARLEQMVRLMSSVVGRIQNDYMEAVIQYGFFTMLRMNQFMPMPDTVSDTDLDIIYTGPISRALQSEVSQSIIMFLQTIAELSQFYPDMLDIPDIDAMTRKLADLSGVPADTLHSADDVEQVRAARAEQQAQMQEAQNIQMGGEAMKSAGEGAMAVQDAGVDMDG